MLAQPVGQRAVQLARAVLPRFLGRQRGKLGPQAGQAQFLALAADIKATLSAPLIANQPKQDITDVLYTAFILR